MPSLGIGELLVVGIILLVAVGPERLPHVTRTLGRLYGRMRRAADELRRTLVLEADRLDEEERLRELRRRRQHADEERKQREAEVGSKAQPEASEEVPVEGGVDGGAEGLMTGPAVELEPQIPPGFNAEEWAELPEHTRNLMLRRRSDP